MIRLLSCRVLMCCSLLALAGCSKPEKERPPEPTAAAAHAELRDAINDPIDKARQVDADAQKAEDEQRAAIEAAGG